MSDIFGAEPTRRGEHAASSFFDDDTFARFDRLIEMAEPGSTPMRLPSASESLVRRSNGWDERFIREENLTGDEWHRIFLEAKTIVNSGGMVAFIGNRGTGKTRMAAEIARSGFYPTDRGEWNGNRVVKEKNALYRRSSDLISQLWDRSKNEHETLNLFGTAGLLVIDELQEGKNHEAADKTFTTVIDKRYGALKPTILIGNLDVADLKTHLSPSVRDRMRENGKAFVFGWESHRKPETT